MAQSLWAKKAKDGSEQWLPLTMHMADSAAVAKKLWNHWVADGVKRSIVSGLLDGGCGERLAVFLAAVHDLGKATPVFQAKRSGNAGLDRVMSDRTEHYGLAMQSSACFENASRTPHALATQVLLRQAGCSKNIAATLGAHHGKPTDTDDGSDMMAQYPQNFHLGKHGKEAWGSVQQELLSYSLKLAGYATINDIPRPNMAAQVLLSGLVILADWIASSEALFPYIGLDDMGSPCAKARLDAAWQALALPKAWQAGEKLSPESLYQKRFSFSSANALQKTVMQTAASLGNPGILVIEAPMGVGKTEAALLAAEIFACTAKRKGVFFALPTQATSDGMFKRFLAWLNKLDGDDAISLRLMHGKAQFNDAYESLPKKLAHEDDENRVIVHEWFAGRKKGMLDDFGVGTIDHVLLAALKQKHVMLRHLGLANKVVIIDECHAYDAYMSQYLYMALRWLGAYQVPVIVLSATLPAKQRQALVEAYLNITPSTYGQSDPLNKGAQQPTPTAAWAENTHYPIITYTEEGKVGQALIASDVPFRRVALESLADDALAETLAKLLEDGGCAGVIVNTVDRAQKTAASLGERFGEATVQLLHSRFLAPDRALKEQELLKELGKPSSDTKRPYKRIVVGTQVLEQSLDIDFDVLVTDLCPMDLLLQRIGRLHRHERGRPQKLVHAKCLLLGRDAQAIEAGTVAVYGEYLLMRTRACLPSSISLPENISRLVREVYGDAESPVLCGPAYIAAKEKHVRRIADKEKRAKDFRLTRPWPEASLIGWLQTKVSDTNEKSGEAAVRDSDESIEVILVQRKNDGQIYFLPWVEQGRLVAQHEPPAYQVAREMARCKVRLPSVLCSAWNINKTIQELERINSEELMEWQKSSWLSGELFVVLDSSFAASLGGYVLTYDPHLGLKHSKEE